MTKKKIAWSIFALVLTGVALIQFVPSSPVIIPALLPIDQREAQRVLGFEGISNFRDLGGYQTSDGRTVKWGQLYRSATFTHASRSDLTYLQMLNLDALIDFRSTAEKDQEPNVLPQPPGFEIIEIPTLDDGNKAVAEIMERVETGNFDGFDPDDFMLEANRQFASTFTPQFRQFMHTILGRNGKPVVWHCSAGKDRTGFAAAILLRTLGVPPETILADYMQSKSHAVDARRTDLLMIRLFAGQEAEEKIRMIMGVEEPWLEMAFSTIDQ